MSATTAPPTGSFSVDAVVEQATPEQRRELIRKLLSKALAEAAYLPQAIPDATGQPVGVFIPHYRSTSTEPPELTREHWAELERRFASSDGWLTPEEFVKVVEAEHLRQCQQ
jgi:hypothetical protein